MPFTPNYKVDFNREIAMTILYQDADGQLLFVFEFAESPKSIVLRVPPLLDNRALHDQEEAVRCRVETACERTKKYLQECGYSVSVK